MKKSEKRKMAIIKGKDDNAERYDKLKIIINCYLNNVYRECRFLFITFGILLFRIRPL